MRFFISFLIAVSVLSASSELQATISDMKEALYKLIEERKELKRDLNVNSLTNSDRDKKIEQIEKQIVEINQKIETIEIVNVEARQDVAANEKHIKIIKAYIEQKRAEIED